MDNNLQRISVSVIPEHYEALKKLSSSGKSIGFLIREAIAEFLISSKENYKNKLKNENLTLSELIADNEMQRNNQNIINGFSNDLIGQLDKLISHKEKGYITEEEFKMFKLKILS